MNNKEHFPKSAEEDDPQLDALIAEALAARVLPPLEDLDEEAAAAVLTQEDRRALDKLGTSAELVHRLFTSDAPEEPAEDASDPPTADRAYVVPLPTYPLAPSPMPPNPMPPIPQPSNPAGSSDDTTQCMNLDETVGSPGSGSERTERSPEVIELKQRLEQVLVSGHVHWGSHYSLDKEIGRGGQGVVYRTRSMDELGGEQALKFYSSDPYDSAAAYYEDMRRLMKGASLVHRIHHDNLVDVQQFVEYEGIYVMVMHWIDGFDLKRLLDFQLWQRLRETVNQERWKELRDAIYAAPESGTLGLRPLHAVNIIEKCLRGLSVLHKRGVVHGDVKPANIMLDRNGSIRLIDIGSACAFADPPRQRIWTPRYAPPEFLEGREWTPQSDIASLGYVLVQLLSGQSDLAGPRVGDDSTREANWDRDNALLEAKRELPDRLSDLLPEEFSRSDHLMRLLQRLIDPVPGKRFTDAKQAIIDRDDGTWHFRKQLIQHDMGMYEAEAIEAWIGDVKKIIT